MIIILAAVAAFLLLVVASTGYFFAAKKVARKSKDFIRKFSSYFLFWRQLYSPFFHFLLILSLQILLSCVREGYGKKADSIT